MSNHLLTQTKKRIYILKRMNQMSISTNLKNLPIYLHLLMCVPQLLTVVNAVIAEYYSNMISSTTRSKACVKHQCLWTCLRPKMLPTRRQVKRKCRAKSGQKETHSHLIQSAYSRRDSSKLGRHWGFHRQPPVHK